MFFLREDGVHLVGQDPAIDVDAAAKRLDCEDLFRRHGPQRLQRVGADSGRERTAATLGVGEPRIARELTAALCNHALEQSCRQRRRLNDVDAPRAGRLAEDRHLAGVAAERGDVVLHPFQRGDVIEDGVVARRMLRRFSGQFGVGQEPERAQPVVRGHDDDTLACERGAVVGVVGTGTAGPGSSVNPHHHRTLVAGTRRGPDIEEQAVLAGRGGRGRVRRSGWVRRLHALRTKGVGPLHPSPRDDRLRRLPAQIADRRRRERNTLEDAHA